MSSPTEFMRATPSRERLTFVVDHGPEQWRPIYRAVRDYGVALAMIEQRSGVFRPPTDKPVVLCLNDDTAEPLGPDGFNRKSVRRFATRARLVVIVSCAPLVPLYAAAGVAAAVSRYDVLLIESQPRWEQDWIDLIQTAHPGVQTLIGAVRPETESRH